jgi:hypothetical protein
MNPTISQPLVQAHQADLLAEAAAVRFANSAKRTTGQAGWTAGTWRFVAAFIGLLGAAVH